MSIDRSALMPLVLVESPFAGDVTANVDYARLCLRDALSRGEAPIASHWLLTQPTVLDDNIPDQRTLGIDAGLAWLREADASVVYIDRGISAGMLLGIDAASCAGVRVEFRRLDGYVAPFVTSPDPHAPELGRVANLLHTIKRLLNVIEREGWSVQSLFGVLMGFATAGAAIAVALVGVGVFDAALAAGEWTRLWLR
jgi:hypothetical protein